MFYIFIMHEVNLKSIDLNLLTALGALLQHQHVTRAANAIGLSQPAMSRALERLRHTFGDPLLVRGPAGMMMTPRAEALAPRVTQVLDGIRGLLVEAPFDPLLAKRTVTIVCTDSHAVTLIPSVLARLRQEAPGVTLALKNYSPDIGRRVQQGEVDLVFSVASQPLQPGAASMRLRQDRLALIMRRDHPLAQTPISLSDYTRCDHAMVSILGDGVTELDAALAAEGLSRRIALTTPHFMAALAAVAKTDLVITLSRSLAQRFAAKFDLILRDPPIKDPDFTQTLVWLQARGHDPLMHWLREVMVQEAQGQAAAEAAMAQA